MDIKRIIGTFCTIYPPNKRNTKWMIKAVVSIRLRCPIIRVLSQMILLLLPCKTRWCHLTVVSKHKKLVSRYQKLHSFNKSLWSLLWKFPTRAETTVTLENSQQLGESFHFKSRYWKFRFTKDVCETLHVEPLDDLAL